MATAGSLGLTTRDTQVAARLVAGASNADAARSLGIAPATVVKHLEHFYAWLGANSRTEAVVLLMAADPTA